MKLIERCIGFAIVAALSVTIAAVPALARSQAACRHPDFTGTFLQLWAVRDDAAAAALNSELRQLRVRDLIVQYTADPPAGTEPDAGQYLSKIRVLLRPRSGVRVWLGGVKSDFDILAGEGEPRVLRERLTAMRATDLKVRHELWSKLSPSEQGSVAGWYVSEELENANWLGEGPRGAEKRAEAQRHFSELVRGLDRFASRPTIITGFANEGPRPDDARTAAAWRDIVRGTGIDLFLFQTGYGTKGDAANGRKMTKEGMRRYGRALERALRSSGDQRLPSLGFDIELYRPGVSAERVPTSMAEIAVQNGVARSIRRTMTIYAFAAPHYMSKTGIPLQPREAKQLFASYYRNLCSR